MNMSGNVILVGMPGCGKSTVGVVLAKTLGFDFIDTDLLICKEQGNTLQKIITDKGLEYFETIESHTGRSLRCENCVVATGGSMILYPEAMENLRSLGTVVFIDVDLAELNRRITNITTRGITFKENETLEDVYFYRRAFYEKYADITVKVSSQNSIETTVEEILNVLNN